MHGRISPRRGCNPCGFTMKMSSRYHRLCIYDVKRNTGIDGILFIYLFKNFKGLPVWQSANLPQGPMIKKTVIKHNIIKIYKKY